MRRITITIIAVSGVILILLASAALFNKTILRSNVPVWVKSVVILLFPPNNIYDPLVVETLDISDGHAKTNVAINNRYMGSHEIGLLFSKFDPALLYQRKYELHLLANITCYVGDELHYSQSLNMGDPFLGKIGSGFSLATYVVPKDLPLDQSINCVFSVSNLNKEFVEKYGPVKLYIKKISDL